MTTNPPKQTAPTNNKIPGELSSSSNLQKPRNYPNPPEVTNPDAAELREQWRFAIRQYSKWYSHAWGSAILAGLSFFALGWFIKGSNPLPSFTKEPAKEDHNDDSAR